MFITLDNELAPIKEQIEEHERERNLFRKKNAEGEATLMKSLQEIMTKTIIRFGFTMVNILTFLWNTSQKWI